MCETKFSISGTQMLLAFQFQALDFKRSKYNE